MRLSKEKQRFVVLGVLLLWCAALIAYRMRLAPDKLPIWLAWNLVLAAVPLLFSAAFRSASARKRSVLAGASFVLWLLFLPNSHYILTDLFHLWPPPEVPLWY